MDLEENQAQNHHYTIILYVVNRSSIDKYTHNGTDGEFWDHYLNMAQAASERYDINNTIHFFRNDELIYRKCLGYNTSEFLLGLIWANRNNIGTVIRETIPKISMG